MWPTGYAESFKEAESAPLTHVWRVRTRHPERYGQSCRVLARARRMNSILVEFADGMKVVTSRHYVRRLTR